ncbi:hypothetical protein L6452_21877 [Arctium lappa]|uniref:Uncharacterized protein n=1 Tax=Arctium lappa TaxID=4217 RepID=A0ACB9AZ55_ARCLA|nr:hypothetical protein L6452_21877 [Arctium lappa]
MASLNPFSLPNSGDKSWVDHISKTLKSQLAVTIDTPPVSIFEIPKTLKAETLEAYTPQRIGLGPNHHFQSELYQKMEQNKLTAVKRVLSSHQIVDHQDQVVEKVREIIPIICACYDLYLDVDDDTLAWLFAIDGLFLLDHLGAFSDHQFGIEAKDLIMLENQIPLIVLKEIQKAILNEYDHIQEDNLESKLQFFCKSHSPFLLSPKKVDFSRVNHILDYMYHSIVNNETWISREVNFTNPESGSLEKAAQVELLEAFIQMAKLIPGAKPFLEIIESIRKDLFDSMEKKPMVEEIKVPSVSELRQIAGVKFRLSPGNKGIRNINFVMEKERSCYLPLITLNIDSEVILRNLVAYEQLMAKNSFAAGYGLELTEYVDFMCGIIDTAKDVRLLRKEKIIEGDLGDEEIVKLFNGIRRSQGKMSVESDLRKIVDELNKVYESMPSVWVQRMAEKQVRGSAKAITYLVSISSTLILIREVYSKVYGSNPPHMMLIRFLSEQIESFSSLIQ